MFVNGVSVRRLTVIAAVLAISGTAVIAPASGAIRSAAAQPAAPAMVPTPARTLFDTGSGVRAPHRRLLGGEQVSVYAFGSAGLPPAGVSAVRVRVQTSGASGAGVLSVHHAGTRDSRPLVLSYRKQATQTWTGTVEFDPDGVLQVDNVSSARVNVRIWVIGYQPFGSGDQWIGAAADAGHGSANAAAAGVGVTSLAHARARWTLPGQSEPLIVGGLSLQFVSDAGAAGTDAVQARDLATGTLRWSVGGLTGANQPQLAVYAGWLYLVYGAEPLDAVAIDLSTHRVVLRTPAAAGVGPAPTAGVTDLSLDGGTMHLLTYVADPGYSSGYSAVAANYDATTGVFLWSRPTPAAQVTAGEGRLLLNGDDGVEVYDGRTGKYLWTDETDGNEVVIAGGRIIAAGRGGVSAAPLSGCGRTRCIPTWTDTFLSRTSRYSSAVSQVSADGSLIATSVFIINGLGNPVSSSLRLISARTGHALGQVTMPDAYQQATPVIGGSAVLFSYTHDLDAVPTTCLGVCSVTRLASTPADGDDAIVGPVAQHTLIFDPDGSGLRVYRLD